MPSTGTPDVVGELEERASVALEDPVPFRAPVQTCPGELPDRPEHCEADAVLGLDVSVHQAVLRERSDG